MAFIYWTTEFFKSVALSVKTISQQTRNSFIPQNQKKMGYIRGAKLAIKNGVIQTVEILKQLRHDQINIPANFLSHDT